jgi:hypothetical protein
MGDASFHNPRFAGFGTAGDLQQRNGYEKNTTDMD